MMKKGISGAFAVFVVVACIPYGKIVEATTLETEARVQVVVDRSSLPVTELPPDQPPLPDFKPTGFGVQKKFESERPQSHIDVGKTVHLPKLNGWIKSGMIFCGMGILLIASALYEGKKRTDRLTLKKG